MRQQVATVADQAAAARRKSEAAARRIAELDRRIGEFQLQSAELARQTERAAAAERALFELRTGTSWRLASIFAGIADRLPPGLRSAGRRAGRLAWWLATGRLITHLRRRRRARRRAALLRVTPLFDVAWYVRNYPDVQSSRLDPVFHFALFGAAENRDCGPNFDAQWYCGRYPDVAASGMHPLLHYLESGAAEGRAWRAVPPPTPALPPPTLPADWADSSDDRCPSPAIHSLPAPASGDAEPRAVRVSPGPIDHRALNRMMTAAFASGAEVYIAAHPGCVFEPDSLIALLRMVRANGRRALVEATRGPEPVPKPVGAGAKSWAVAWSCGACLAIPRRVYEAIGGFDESLACWGADVDFSWRARAAGFSVLLCPEASFELPFRAEAEAIPAGYLGSAVLLARKWRLSTAEPYLTGLFEKTGEILPEAGAAELAETALAAADFGSGPFFGDKLW